LLPVAFVLFGCKTPQGTTLNSTQAGVLAQRLANEGAQSLYSCQPFRDSHPARFVGGHWVWHDLRGQDRGDVEVTVEFAVDGAKPAVSLTLLDSRHATHEY